MILSLTKNNIKENTAYERVVDGVTVRYEVMNSLVGIHVGDVFIGFVTLDDDLSMHDFKEVA